MRTVLHFIRIAFVLGLLTGCGGGSHGGGTGKLNLTVHWPQRTRLIPDASNSIKAVLTHGSTTLDTKTLARPTEGPWTTTVTFDNLEAGEVLLTATAYPSAEPGPSDVAQAAGSAPASIVGGQTTAVTVTMDSTIDHVEITPVSPSVEVDKTAQLTMTAWDKPGHTGSIVLTTPGKITWQSGSTANATVSSPGNPATVTGKAAGSSVITVTETESGKQATTTVTVTAPTSQNPWPISMAIDPTGGFAYVAEFGDILNNGTFHGDIRQFSVAGNGTLADLSPASETGVDQPRSIAAHPSAPYVYAANWGDNTISQYRVNTNGTLSPLSPARVTLPGAGGAECLAMDPGGSFLFVTSGTAFVTTATSFRINADGTLTQVWTDVIGGQAVAIKTVPTASGTFVYMLQRLSPSIAAFRVNTDGSLTGVGGFNSQPEMWALDARPAGNLLYVAHGQFGQSVSPGVYVLRIETAGNLTQIANITMAGQPFTVGVDPSGNFAYIGDQGQSTISQFRINQDGTLTPLAPATVSAAFPSSITISKNGQFLYATNRAGSGPPTSIVSQFRINQDGTLTPL
jgi:6-phosphogluconolactonase (cycloisomerase 2 family)